jgi:ribosomal protein L16 Arg81 hydroxylase
MDSSLSLDKLLQPIGLERFLKEYKDKKHFVIKSKENIFANHFSWEELDNYLNQYNIQQWDRTPQLQVVLPNGTKWCKKKSVAKKTREDLLKLWRDGSSFIITLSEFLNKTMWNQTREFEKHYGIGQANIYCSNQKDAKCFPIHADSTDNFLFHVSGKIRWYIYEDFASRDTKKEQNKRLRADKFAPKLLEVLELDDGDLLYIPAKQYHKVDTLSPRISISFHFREPYDGWKPHSETGARNKWYNWEPGEIYGTTK